MAKRKAAPKKAAAKDTKAEKEKKRELNFRQRDFVRWFLLCRNASEAYRRAGYSSKNPDVDASKLLVNPSIKQMIADEEAAIQKKYEATREEIIDLLAGIALLDPLDVLDQDDEGETTFKMLAHMPKQARLALEIMGSPKRKNPFISLRSMRKRDALEYLTKYLGIENGAGSGSNKDTKRAALERVRDYLNRRLEKE